MNANVAAPATHDAGHSARYAVGLGLLVLVLDGFDLMVVGIAARAIAADLGLSPRQLGLLFVSGIVGMIGGSVLIAPLGDRLGRRRLLVLSCTLFGVCAGMTALAGSYWSLVGLRLLTGFGLGAASPNATAVIAEHVSPRHRQLLVGVGLVGLVLGGMLCAALAVLLLPRFGWPSLFLVGGVLPLLLAPVLWRFLPDAPAPDSLATAPGLAHGERGGVRRLLAADLGPDTRRFWLAFFVSLTVVYFLMNWLPYLAGQAGFSSHQSSLGALALNFGSVLGPLLLVLAYQRLDPRRVIGSSFVLAAASLVALSYATGSFGTYLVAAALAGFFVFGAQIGLHTLIVSTYPTALRATGTGWALGIGRIGAVFGPLLGGEMLRSGVAIQHYFVGLGLAVLLAAAATFTLSRRVTRIE